MYEQNQVFCIERCPLTKGSFFRVSPSKYTVGYLCGLTTSSRRSRLSFWSSQIIFITCCGNSYIIVMKKSWVIDKTENLLYYIPRQASAITMSEVFSLSLHSGSVLKALMMGSRAGRTCGSATPGVRIADPKSCSWMKQKYGKRFATRHDRRNSRLTCWESVLSFWWEFGGLA